MTPCEQPRPADRQPTLLVIDDELGPRESLRFLFKDDYHVMCADTVDRGIQMMKEKSPDTVIMDIRMPGRSGLDGLREIRRLDSNLAVIMLTGYAAVGTAQEAIRHEASDYMEKPFDATEMRDAVRRHVEHTRLRRKQSKLLSEADALDRRICELREKERLAELGLSSSEFVHDLRNALAIVTNATSLLRMEVSELQQLQSDTPSEASSHLDLLENAMQQCVGMLTTWQSLIQQRPQLQTWFRVHEFARACLETCRPAAQAVGAQVVCETLGDDVELLGDRVQLARALANLIQNAIHALPAENGLIRVRSEILKTSVRVSVSDNGCGISEANLQHIFSPNFSTRHKLGGMGLGLFIAQKVAQAHGGVVTVESAVNRGSTFSLLLPRNASVTGGGAV